MKADGPLCPVTKLRSVPVENISDLELVLRKERVRYEKLPDGVLGVPVMGARGGLYSILFQKKLGEEIRGAAKFPMPRWHRTDAKALCSSFTVSMGILQASYNEQIKCFYLGADFQPIALALGIDDFADVCDRFYLMLQCIEETGEWSPGLFARTLSGNETLH